MTDGSRNGMNLLTSHRIDFDSYEQMLDEFDRREWGDGLPVVPATPEIVARFVAAAGRPGSDVVGDIPPSWGEATVEKVAINAVMAGCRAEFMPVVLTALEAMLVETFNLYGLQATTHPAAPLIVVSGPVAKALGINAGYGAFGPGARANATIGRAIRLVLLNVGGARPGIGDRSTQGQPSKYTYCVAENDEATPWEPLRVSEGFGVSDSMLALNASENPHNINDHGSFSGEQILTTIAGAMKNGGANNLYFGGTHTFLFLCPEHAEQIGADGYKRADIQQFLFENARTPVGSLGSGQLQYMRQRHRANPRYKELGMDDPELKTIPMMTRPEDLKIVVLGGAGKHSSWAPPTGALSKSVMRRLP
jgi:hypothetical protein